MSQDIAFEIDQVEVRDGVLRVTYALTNGLDTPLYLFNMLPDSYGQLRKQPSETPTPALAQTCLHPPDTMFMLMGATPTPNFGPGVMFYGPRQPLATRLDPAAGYSATLRAPLPLSEWTEYTGPHRPDPERAPQPTAISTVTLAADFILGRDVDHEREDEDYPGVFHVGGTTAHRIETSHDIASMGLVLMRNPEVVRF
ncbi:MAG: hypothetical protein K0V04_33630 [Deltaproteobacteria bacterium]|nr:hypothetical protein [Deltaproteobacteria bacterium]